LQLAILAALFNSLLESRRRSAGKKKAGRHPDRLFLRKHWLT
jgi:hypothetical protein